MTPILANNWPLAQMALREVAAGNIIFIDTETSGLDDKRNHIVGYVLKQRGGAHSYYVPIRHLGGGNLPGCNIPQSPEGWRGDLHPFEIELARIARDRPRRWVGHNLDFDLKMSRRHGVEYYGDYEDTMLNAALVDENQWSFSLENVAKYMEVTPKKGDDLYEYLIATFGGKYDRPSKSMENFWRTDASVDIVWQYAAGDDITTEEVWVEQQKVIEAEDLGRVHSVECRLIRTIFRMTSRGVRIDEDQLHRVHDKFGQLAKRHAGDFPEGFKSNAPSHILKYLGDDIGPNWPRNPVTAVQMQRASKKGEVARGALKFDEETLMLTPKGANIILTRKLEHAQSAFTTPLIERHLYRGRVHTSFNQMKKDDYGTVSGRLSSSDPNLQQVPKRDKVIGPIYRTVFLPEEGHYWDTNDYKQQEYVVFTEYTGDKQLVAGYNADPPVDIHQMVANVLLEAGFTWVLRDPHGKRINLALLYGMGKAKLARSLGCSEADAQKIMDAINRLLPGIKGTPMNPGFIRKAEKLAKRRGYVHTMLGRRRRLTFDTAHKAGNSVIQGSSADITKLKMVEVDDYFESEGDEAYLMLQVHDALDNSIPIGKEYLAEGARKIMKAFGPDDEITMKRVPMGLDSGQGPNWSVATYGQAKVDAAWAS